MSFFPICYSSLTANSYQPDTMTNGMDQMLTLQNIAVTFRINYTYLYDTDTKNNIVCSFIIFIVFDNALYLKVGK